MVSMLTAASPFLHIFCLRRSGLASGSFMLLFTYTYTFLTVPGAPSCPPRSRNPQRHPFPAVCPSSRWSEDLDEEMDFSVPPHFTPLQKVPTRQGLPVPLPL